MKNKTSEAAFFDLDSTLVNLNSSYDFVSFYLIHTKNVPKISVYFVFQIASTIGIIKSLFKERRFIYFKFLKGESKEQIEKVARLYVDKRLYQFTNQAAFDILQGYKKKKYHTVLISASLEPVVTAYAVKAGIDQSFASTLAYKNGICQGKLDDDLSARKHHKWAELEKILGHSLDPKSCYFLSDNQEDYELMKKIPSAAAVVYDSFQARYWKDRGITTKFIPPNNSPLRFQFFLPSTYYFRTRKPTRDLLLVHLPFFAAVILLGLVSIPPFWPVLFALSWLGYIAIYELGYFINDLMALKYETNPTLNFDLKTASFVRYYIPTRVLFLAVLLLIFNEITGLTTLTFLIGIAITSLVFLLHDLLPRTLRLFTFPVLKLTHLLVPLLIFQVTNLPVLMLAVVIFYLGKEMVYYYRKVRNLSEWNSQLKLRFVVVPKLTILTAVFLASFFYQSLLSLFWLGLSLSIPEIGFVGKKVLTLARKFK